MTIDINAVLTEYQNLKMICPNCGKKHSIPVPVNFNNLNCDDCHSSLDPAFWSEGRVVDHFLMRKLISTCYKHTDFAKKLIEELYNRDYHHAKNEEFGIDKKLLLIHAANALIQNGHRSKLIYITSLFSLIPVIGAFVPFYLTSKKLYRNLEYREKFCCIDAYDPCQIASNNYEEIKKIISFTEHTQPYNLFFSSQYNPFQQFGHDDGMWSFLIDRRKLVSGEIKSDPISLDINSIYSKIIERVCKMQGAGISQFRFHVDDILLVDGRLANPKDKKLFRYVDHGYYPREFIKNSNIVELHNVIGDVKRVFKRITFYNPQRQLCVRSFIRIQHQGSFTYIESIGTRLLPLVDRVYSFQEKTIANELDDKLEKEFKFLGFWLSISISPVTKERITFVYKSMIYSCLALLLTPIMSFIVTLTILIRNHGFKPKKKDIYTSGHQEEGLLNLILNFFCFSRKAEHERIKILQKIGHRQETNESSFSPHAPSLRKGQSRYIERNFFELVDLKVLRKTQNLAIQEAFLECLDEAGIDATDFRKGTAQINNYGIINSGKISGNVKTESTISNGNKNNKTEPKNKNEG